MTDIATDQISVSEGRLIGPWRAPKNQYNNTAGSIHDDATAQRLGFRGGTVAGNIHFEMMAPLLVRALGQRWFERGTLSIEFKYAAQDKEQVRGIVALPPEGATDAQVDVLIEHSNGETVGLGTAAVGDPGVKTWLGAKDLSKYDMGDYEILRDIRPGDVLIDQPAVIEPELAQSRQKVNTEPLPWYAGESPWGGAIVTPTLMVRSLVAYTPLLRERKVRGVGLYGAIEIRNVNGPVFVGETYTAGGEVVARGQSPRSEYFWFESHLDDKSGKRTAEMLMQLRFMKGSQDLANTR